MDCLQGEADLVAPIWTGDVGRMKVLFLSSPLGSTFGQGVARPSFFFSTEKLPAD